MMSPMHAMGGPPHPHHHQHPHHHHPGVGPGPLDVMNSHAAPGGGASPAAGGSGGLHHHQQQQQQQQQQTPHPVVPVGSTPGSAAPGASGGGPPQVSLSLLIEFIVQRTYHDLTVLAELLPRKTDMERKVEIFNYASRTRMILIRLLSLVKWASSASKVDKCVSIMNFCERSSNLFLDTADNMARMARETLVRATLPNFHLPAAVEILTTGSYNRVPRCIRDRIVPPEPITLAEKRKVLLQLNQVIEQRLVTSDLPLQMRNLSIADGRVTFSVANEFAASLTVMGDGGGGSGATGLNGNGNSNGTVAVVNPVPWRLLGISVLVEDKETGEGKPLMHSMQIRYVEQLVQSRLAENLTNPLQDLYATLHSLCQSLQLEVLHSQTQRLCHERLGRHIRVEEYKPGKCLTVSYWREMTARDPKAEVGYRFSVQVDPHDPAQPLMVFHVPPLSTAEAVLAEQAIRSEQISMERLLVHTIYVRTKARLGELKQELQHRLNLGDVEASLHGSPAVLSVPILHPCMRSEQLLVTVDTHTGGFLAHVPQYEENPVTPDIQQTLNEDKSRLESLVSQLRYWITKQRVHKTLQQLPASSHETLPILFDLSRHPLKDLSGNKMYIRLHRHPNALLLVDFQEKESNQCEVEYKYYLLWVRPASIEDNPKDESIVSDIPRVYLKALSMAQFDPFLLTHGSDTRVDVKDLSERIIGKRKFGGKVEAPIKRTKFPAYFLSDLAHAVSFADERIPFTLLTAELDRREGVAHSGVEAEAGGVGLVTRIVRLPGKESKLQSYLLSISIRLQNRNGRFWRVEFSFCGNPVWRRAKESGNPGSSSSVKSLCFTFEMAGEGKVSETVDAIIEEWVQMTNLYDLASDLNDYLNWKSSGVSDFVSIKSFNYKDITLTYGPGGQQLLHVRFCCRQKKFLLVLGGMMEGAGMNPQHLVEPQLEQHLNEHKNLALTAKILHETYAPMRSLCRLPNIPQMGVSLQRVNIPVETFVVLAQSPTHVKVIFYNTYCLDVQIKAGGLVLVRDGAISLFNQRKVLEEMQPIQGLKSFLMRYVDESALQRRQSQTEDDNPPSPIEQSGSNDAASLKFTAAGGGQTPSSSTPPGSNNPLTPSGAVPSPHSSGGFLQSPPPASAAGMRQPSPAAAAAPSPGGGGFPVPSPLPGGGPSSVGSPAFPPAQSPLAAGSPAPGPRPSPRSGLSPHPSSHRSTTSTSLSAAATSRILPQRLWAGAQPTPLTPQAFDEICKPTSQQQQQQLAPIHRFLGCLFLRRQLAHMIRQEEFLQPLPSSDPTILAFKVDGLTCRVSCFAANNYQSLHCKLEPDQAMMREWTPDMLQVLERFFDTRVAVAPFRPHALTAFVRILGCPVNPLKDMVNIIRLEIQPELAAQQNLKWACRICLTVPPAAPPIIPLGQPGLLRLKEKMLLFLQITRTNVQLPSGQEPLSVVIPLVYDIQQNQTTVAQKEMTPVISLSNQHLQRLARSGQLNLQRCTIFPCVQELLFNLSLPNEGPPHQMMQPQFNQTPQTMGQMGQMAPAGMRPQMGPQMSQAQRMMGMQQQRAQMMQQQQQQQQQPQY